MDFDDELDGLSAYQRNKVLAALGAGADDTQQGKQQENHLTGSQELATVGAGWYIAITLSLAWTGLVGMVGLVLLLVAPPVGMVLLVAAGVPTILLLNYRLEKDDDNGRGTD